MIVQTHFISRTAILSAVSVGLLYLTGCSVAPSTAKPDSNTINTPATIPNTQANPDTQALTTRSLDKALQNAPASFWRKPSRQLLLSYRKKPTPCALMASR